MNIFRFLPNGSAEIHKGELRNRVLYVSPKECYGMKTEAIGYIWRSRLFGFLKPKRTQIVTVRVGDGTPTNGFVNLSMKVGRGRTPETRLEIGKELFDLLIEHLEPLFQKQGLAVSFEMRELEEKVKFNKKNL